MVIQSGDSSINTVEEYCACRGYSHEDGTVRFWDVSSAHMQHLYTLSTSHIFGEETVSSFEVASNLDTDYEWPPFRRVCTVIVIVVEYFISIN